LVESPEYGCAVIAWGEACSLTADQLLARPDRAEAAHQRGAVAAAGAFLRAELAAGPKPGNALKAAAAAAGVSWRSVERAKDQIGVEVRKSGFGGGWEWALKDAADTKTASVEDVAALAKTANGRPAQPLDSTTKTAKPPEDRQAASVADLDGSAGLAEGDDGHAVTPSAGGVAADVLWRVEAMRLQVPPAGPIPYLKARPTAQILISTRLQDRI
jgi:hypothetical protein